MKRRDVLKTSSLILGYAITGGTAIAVLNGCEVDQSPDWVPTNMTPDQAALVELLADTILPASASGAPGATEAKVVRFLDAVLDCYEPQKKSGILDGLALFENKSNDKFGSNYAQLDNDQRLEVMEDMLGGEALEQAAFRDIRSNTIVGFCYSEVGATQVLKFDPVPGHPYQGCVDFSEIGSTWSITR